MASLVKEHMNIAELKTAVEDAGYEFGKSIPREEVTFWPVRYTDNAGDNRKAWVTWHPTKTEKGTHTPRHFDTQTLKPLTKDDFGLPLFARL